MITSKLIAEQVARYLLDVKAVQLNWEKPFTWTSGWKSPIYCDNRLTLSYPEVRQYIKNSFIALAHQQFPNAEVIAGVATAGIPNGALIADALGLPFVYVRSKPKEHGKENLIEGAIMPQKRVLIVEDVISTGKSTLQAADALQDAGFVVDGVIGIFTYGFDFVMRQFTERNIPFNTLSNYAYLLQEYTKRETLSEAVLESLQRWRDEPQKWQ
ncbi:MAG: orotate phosphoribosyltransferase [Bacteroidetes bacterium]|nr:MAG: orotate phosphoribosyltransferase [Bacteroidota bacterium]